MPDLEQVIGNIRIIRTWAACSAIRSKDMGRIRETMDDALTLLETQRPRLLTLEEIPLTAGILWLEENDCVCAAMFERLEPQTVFGRMTNILKFNLLGRSRLCGHDVMTYGRKWRCWTQCPTTQQRKAEKWNGEQSQRTAARK